MGLILVVLAGVLGWLWWTGRLPQSALRWVVIGISLVLAAFLVMRASPFLALLLLGVTGVWAWTDMKRAAPRTADEEEALRVLGLEKGATEAQIRAKHRLLIAEVHPDRGGDPDLARKLNEARDFLLAAARKQD
ncbi:MAG: J domain-containing protein [Thermaurantiacus sp.]